MSLLQNDSNILLDTVITDEGRRRLARGDGSFKITKFALSDDEINYGNYNKNHASGSAYYDLSILQSPVFEAFTNNTSTMKHKLISIPRTNLLYLPVVKINEVFARSTRMFSSGSFHVAVNKDTEDSFSTLEGFISGESSTGGTYIRVDQGLDTVEISPNSTIDADLVETQYIIEIDNRLGKIISTAGTLARVSFIDDDNIALYYLSLGTDVEFVQENTEREKKPTQTIVGPRGTVLQFSIQSSLELNTSDFLFDQIGDSINIIDTNSKSIATQYIDSYVKCTGITTGASVLIPVRYIRNQWLNGKV